MGTKPWLLIKINFEKMKIIKQLSVLFLVINIFNGCTKKETSYALQNVSAPTEVNAVFDIAQDDSGDVSVTPTAVGASLFKVYFGEVEDETPVEVNPGDSAEYTYGEGEFTLRIVAVGLSGLTSELSRIVTISFSAPTDLQLGISVSATNPLEITVTPTATNATVFDIYYGDAENEEPTTIMAGESAVHVYAQAGDYTVRVVARGAGAASIEASEVVSIESPNDVVASDFIGTWKMAPEAGSLGVGPAPGDTSFFAIDDQGVIDRACYFDDSYVFGSDGSFANVLGAETWIEGWQGGSDACGTPVAPHDGSAMATYSYDEGAGTITVNGTGAYIGLAKANNQGELPNVAVPSSITYTVSLTDNKNTMNAFIEVSAGVFWQFKLIKDVPPAIEGTWKMAPEAGSLGVGPAPGDTSFFAIDDQGVIDRACYFDDSYIFGSDGSFANVLGSETWIEAWQGGSDACGAPVAPHDGSAMATYSYDQGAGTLTVNGIGAYIGLAKANNQGELPNVAVPSSITYDVTFTDNNNTMNAIIEVSTGVFWQFKLIRDVPPVIAGTWKMAPEAGSLGVGPAPGDTSFFAIDDQGVIDRACYFDDSYVFGSDGSFANVLGAETWIEAWQGGSDACGTPVAPHDGSAMATYSYDEGAGTLTVNGAGAYIGLAKANNQGELPNVAVPSSITYTVSLTDNNNTMNALIEVSTGVFWQFKLIRE